MRRTINLRRLRLALPLSAAHGSRWFSRLNSVSTADARPPCEGNDDVAARGHSAGQPCGTPDVKPPAQAIEIASGFIQPERNPSIRACTRFQAMSDRSAIIRRMTNARILAGRVADLLRREHAAMADFLVALAEFDACKAWEELGYSSLFHFLHRELGLSKGAAHYRKTAAALVRRFPEIVEPLRDGRLCITSIVYLDKVLTPENRYETLPKFFQRSRRESIAIAAALKPADAVPQRDVVTASRAVLTAPVTEPVAASSACTVGRLAVQPVCNRKHR
jgi:hypothetical protein